MPAIRTACIYCGTRDGHDPSHIANAAILGRLLAEARIVIVYGGASIGVMGALARGALDAGGHVIGIIPDFLTEREAAFTDVSQLIVTPTMHERKQRMYELADAFVALPGGIGTLEELVEMMTWLQLGQHAKPIVLGNFAGFWNPLIELLEHMRTEGFITPSAPVGYWIATSPQDVARLLSAGSAERAAF